MSDSKIHHHVGELVKLLGNPTEKLREGSLGDDYSDILQKSRNQMSASRNIKNVLESSHRPDDVHKKYEELKIKQVKEVDPLVCLISKIQNDDKVKNLLKKDKANGSSDVVNEKSNHLNLSGKLPHKESLAQRQSATSVVVAKKESLEAKAPNVYPLPNWIRERCNLTWDFLEETADLRSNADNSKSQCSIGNLPPNVQESRLIDDILFCLVGINGDYIHAKKMDGMKDRSFFLDDSANISLRLLVQNIIPLFTYYSTIISFVEAKLQYEEGLVNHAISAAIHAFVKDYFILVSQLENQHLQHNLTLQKLWFYLQPSLATMETIAGIVSTLSKNNSFGGNVLSVLHESTSSLTGSSKSREICHFLTRAATVPYFHILEEWIYKGIISDHYSEFLVEDTESVKNEELPFEYSNDYWKKRYIIRRDRIPTFLTKAADMILRTGKYLNVIRQCGKTVDCPDAKSIVYTERESQYVEYIEPAYKFASKKLLDLLMDEADLRRRLISVKHYFLLDQGDFIVQFMDMAEEELQKQTDDVHYSRLESLLELALRTSVVNEDKYKDDVKVDLKPTDLFTQMCRILQLPPDVNCDYRNTDSSNLTGLEAFSFAYEVNWPLSLVINKKALAYYQILFRHLFYCKHVENQLGRLWALNKRTKYLPRSELGLYAPAFALRQRMLNFIQNLDYYLTLEVIEPHWNDFFRKISQVTNVDEVLYYHNDFLEKCVTDCMLTNPKLLHVLAMLMKLCVHFSTFLQDIMKSCINSDVSVMVDSMYSINEHPFTEMSSCPATLENFLQKVSSFEKKFNEGIICMLNILHTVNESQQTSKIINMLYRLDFSRFYEEMSLKNQ